METPYIYQTPSDSTILLANKAYDNQDYGQAATLYLSYLESDSLSLFAIERAAIATHRLGDIPAARDLFLSLEKKDSTSMVALSTLASIYDYEKNSPKAIKYYTALINYYPENAINYRKLAQQYQQAGLKSFAIQYYKEALDLNPKDQFSLRGLSELYLRDKKYITADSLLRLGLQMDSLNIGMNLLQAQSKYLQKAYDSTAYYMERIKGKYDFRPHQNKMLGYAYVQIDSLDDAIHYLNQAINDPGTKEISSLLYPTIKMLINMAKTL